MNGRNPKLILERCNDSDSQRWIASSEALNDFTLQSYLLEQCLDVNGYAVKGTEVVQLETCQEAFDDYGRPSDQFLQFSITYQQIGIRATDAVIERGDAAKLSCMLTDTPKRPDYVTWNNSEISIEEFNTATGYSISTGIYANNSMLAILTISPPVTKPDKWTCLFIVDERRFSAVSDIDIPNVTCEGYRPENDINTSLQCTYTGKYKPSRITWQVSGKTLLETKRMYDIKQTGFSNRKQITTIYFPRSTTRLVFTCTFVTMYKTISKTVATGPHITFLTTSPPWRASVKTSFPTYKFVDDQNSINQSNNNVDQIEANLSQIIENSGALNSAAYSPLVLLILLYFIL